MDELYLSSRGVMYSRKGISKAAGKCCYYEGSPEWGHHDHRHHLFFCGSIVHVGLRLFLCYGKLRITGIYP